MSCQHDHELIHSKIRTCRYSCSESPTPVNRSAHNSSLWKRPVFSGLNHKLVMGGHACSFWKWSLDTEWHLQVIMFMINKWERRNEGDSKPRWCTGKHDKIRFPNLEVGINLEKIYTCSSWVIKSYRSQVIHQLVVQNKVPYSKWIVLSPPRSSPSFS